MFKNLELYFTLFRKCCIFLTFTNFYNLVFVNNLVVKDLFWWFKGNKIYYLRIHLIKSNPYIKSCIINSWFNFWETIVQLWFRATHSVLYKQIVNIFYPRQNNVSAAMYKDSPEISDLCRKKNWTNEPHKNFDPCKEFWPMQKYF